jgi:hypothetical protein
VNRSASCQVDPWHRHQPAHLGAIDRGLGERAVDQCQLVVEEVDLAQAAHDGVALVVWELEALEGLPALVPATS